MLFRRILKRLLSNLYDNSFKFINKNVKSTSIVISFQQSTRIQTFKTSSCVVNKKHTTKRWYKIAREGEKDALLDFSKRLTCEEGADAVPHSLVVSTLQNCNSVNGQINEFCSLISLTSEDMKHRKEFCESLNEVLRPYFSKIKVHQFGSSINGLGSKGCDLDISIQTLFNDEGYLKGVSEVPTLESVLQGETTYDYIAQLPPRFLLRYVRRVLRKHCTDIKEPILIIPARCPVLRFYNAKYDLYCDLTCANTSSLRNTKLIRLCCHLDDRFASLAKFIRYWGKYGEFVGDIALFNSYAFSLLVVHFLQSTDPPVLPPISELLKHSDYLKHADIDDDEIMLKDLRKIAPSQNKQTVDELLRQYFFYFLDFDFSNVIVPLTSMVVPIKNFILTNTTEGKNDFELSTITVQDPFRPYFNTTAKADFPCCKRFIHGVIQAGNEYHVESVWIPGSCKWGITSLFHEPVSENEIRKQWQENTSHTLKLPLKRDAMIIKSILELLLFECNAYKINKQTNNQLVLRLNCKVYNHTWQGRYWFHQKHKKVINDPFELEGVVSKEVIKNRNISKNALFTFVCECYEDSVNKELTVILNFKDVPFNLAILSLPLYLKEFISSLYSSCKE